MVKKKYFIDRETESLSGSRIEYETVAGPFDHLATAKFVYESLRITYAFDEDAYFAISWEEYDE